MSNQDTELYINGIPADEDELDWMPAWKRTLQVEAVRMDQPFTVDTLEGTMDGQAGDYLVEGVVDELYPVDYSVFAQTYTLDETVQPRYSDEDCQEALDEFRKNSAEYLGVSTNTVDAIAGAEAFYNLLRRKK